MNIHEARAKLAVRLGHLRKTRILFLGDWLRHLLHSIVEHKEWQEVWEFIDSLPHSSTERQELEEEFLRSFQRLLRSCRHKYGSRTMRDWFDWFTGHLGDYNPAAQAIPSELRTDHWKVTRLEPTRGYLKLPLCVRDTISRELSQIRVGALPDRWDFTIQRFLSVHPSLAVRHLRQIPIPELREARLALESFPFPRSRQLRMKRLADRIGKITIQLEQRQKAAEMRIFMKQRMQAEREEERRKREEAKQEAQQEQFRVWEERLVSRCARIVGVFNAVFDRAIDPEGVLRGEVTGAYASIHSRGGSGPSLSMQIELRQTLSLQQCIALDNTWLELEEGASEEEWKATYTSENFLVWHELGHLVDERVFDNVIDPIHVLAAMVRGSEPFLRCLREVVVDAVGLRLGEALYVHPGEGSFVAGPSERLQVMIASHHALAKRISRWARSKELDENTLMLLARLLAELEVHAERVRGQRLGSTIGVFRRQWGSQITLYASHFAQVYRRALALDPSTLYFRESLTEESSEEFARAPLVEFVSA